MFSTSTDCPICKFVNEPLPRTVLCLAGNNYQVQCKNCGYCYEAEPENLYLREVTEQDVHERGLIFVGDWVPNRWRLAYFTQ